MSSYAERRLRRLSDEYFAACGEDRHPSLPGLALALGFSCAGELMDPAPGDEGAARVLRQARSRVEEANIQSLYKKDSAGSAKFVLQSSFGYSEKAGPGTALAAPGGEIVVTIQEDADE